MGVHKQLKNPDPPLKGQSGARILLEHTSVKNPNWPETNHLTHDLQSVVEDLSSGLT